MKLLIATFLPTLLAVNLAHAQENADYNTASTYSFGGACSSQGNWTNEALKGTQNLIQIADNLKNDPRCGSLAKAMAGYLAQLQTETATVDSVSSSANKLSNLKDETLALRNFLTGNTALKSNVIQLILNNTVDSAKVSTDLFEASAGTTAAGLISVGQRINRSTTTSLDILNQVADSAMREQTCLSSPNTMGPLLTGLIQVGSAFASSGQDSFGVKLSTFVNKLSTIMRDARYANVLKQLNQTQLRNSMACLLEVTSESYCSTLDAAALFKEQMSRYQITADAHDNLKVTDNANNYENNPGPLDGYYLLTQQIPTITNWLEKVQRGVEPKLKTDATFKNNTIQTVMNFYLTENTLLGDINTSTQTMRNLPTLQAKKNMVFQTLMSLSNKLANNGISNESNSNNFFTVNMREIEIPFALIGRDVPAEVLGQGKSDFMQSPADWLQARLPTLREFDNPDALMETIHTNLKNLIESSQASAVSYYNEWFIYDNAALYVDSVTGMRYNVRDSLKSVDQYLEGLEKKISTSSSMDVSILPSIHETRSLIGGVLDKYEEIRVLGQTFAKASPDDRKAIIEKGKQLHQDLIETVYTNFNVLKGKSGFLSNRMSGFVKYDFQNMLKSNADFSTENIKKIFYATGDAAFEKMKQMSSGNPKDIMTDLNNAQLTHLENISALEMMLKDRFLATIAYTKLVSENKTPSDNDIRIDSRNRAWHDYWQQYPIGSRNAAVILEILVKPFDYYFSYYKGNPDRYPPSLSTTYGNNITKATLDNENHAARRMYELYCVQSLAFSDWKPFYNLCKDVVIQGPFAAGKMDSSAQAKFNDTLTVNYAKKLSAYMTPGQEDRSKNFSSRICALRDFGRNNYVMYLTLGAQAQRQNAQ